MLRILWRTVIVFCLQRTFFSESRNVRTLALSLSSLNLIVSGGGEHEAGECRVVTLPCSRKKEILKSRKTQLRQTSLRLQIFSNSSLENGRKHVLVLVWPKCSRPSWGSEQRCKKSFQIEHPGWFQRRPSLGFSSSGQKVAQSFDIAIIWFLKHSNITNSMIFYS